MYVRLCTNMCLCIRVKEYKSKQANERKWYKKKTDRKREKDRAVANLRTSITTNSCSRGTCEYVCVCCVWTTARWFQILNEVKRQSSHTVCVKCIWFNVSMVATPIFCSFTTLSKLNSLFDIFAVQTLSHFIAWMIDSEFLWQKLEIISKIYFHCCCFRKKILKFNNFSWFFFLAWSWHFHLFNHCLIIDANKLHTYVYLFVYTHTHTHIYFEVIFDK